MWVAIIVAYNKTIDVIFRILDWANGRPRARLVEERRMLEEASRMAQIKGDLNELIRIRAQIENIDSRLKFHDY